PHPALGRRRPDRAGQPGTALPLSPSLAPPRRHHHHRTRRRPHRHRHRRPTTAPRIAGAPTNSPPTRRRALPRTPRRTRRLVVVHTLPTAAPAIEQLELKHSAAHTNPTAEPAAATTPSTPAYHLSPLG